MEEENQNSFLDNRSFSLFRHFFYNLWKGDAADSCVRGNIANFVRTAAMSAAVHMPR